MEKFIRNSCCYLLSATILASCVTAPSPKKDWDCAGAQAEYSRLLASYEKTKQAQVKETARAKANFAGDFGRVVGSAIGLALAGVGHPVVSTLPQYGTPAAWTRARLVGVWKETKRLCGS